jgi:hypothetical protein
MLPLTSRFNAPRNQLPGSSSLFSSSPSARTTYDPLASSSAAPSDDPWAATPSMSASTPSFPALTSSGSYTSHSSPGPPPPTSGFGNAAGRTGGGSGLVDEERLSPVYMLALEAVDPFGKGEGGVSVAALGRVLRCSGLGAGEVEHVRLRLTFDPILT